MRAASAPRPARDVRVLVIDGARTEVVPAPRLERVFSPGDLIVVNDAATLPASLFAHTPRGARIELRLAANLEGARAWTCALLGAGDHRMRTEDRPPPPAVEAGARLVVDGPDGLVAVVTRVHALSRRLIGVRLELPLRAARADADVWAALYRAGRPVQYAHVPAPVALWDVQNAWAARPWAVEMPSAGRAITVELVRALRRRGVAIASVTHAAGLSAVGDAAIDAALPLPERYDVPEETVRAVSVARRVIAVGTSVARALEGAAAAHGGRLVAGEGRTDLLLGERSRLAVVDAVLTGVHEETSTHHRLLGAFAGPDVLARALDASEAEGLLAHEHGDAWLVWGELRESLGRGSGRDTIRRTDAGASAEALRSCAMPPA